MTPDASSDFTVLPSPDLDRAAKACPLLETEKAKGEWISCCSRRFFPLAKRIAGNDDLAMDVLQISWIKVLQATNVGLGGPKACPWVAAVVANSAKDALRRQNRRREVSLAPFQDPSVGPTAETRVQEQEMLQLLREMVAVLPEIYRQIVELRLDEHLSTEEAAERLGIPRSTAASRLHRAVKMLNKSITARIEGEESAGDPTA